MNISIKKNNILLITFIMILISDFTGCSSEQKTEPKISPEEPGFFTASEDANSKLPAEFRRNGMISSSTYQVYMQVFAETESDVMKTGKKSAQERAFQLLRKEPFINPRISEYGIQTLKKLIADNGKIIRAVPDGPRTWSLVFQISKIGLRENLKAIY
jgi:hypothetical protein